MSNTKYVCHKHGKTNSSICEKCLPEKYSSLPKWIQKWGIGKWITTGDKAIFEALSIAWEILELMEWSRENSDGTPYCDSCGLDQITGHHTGCRLKGALRRIEELGK